MSLRLLLDSANPEDWQDWWQTGLFTGITTNPTLLRRAKRACNVQSLKELSARALELGVTELHLQAWGANAHALEACATELASIEPNLTIVKLPVSRAGLLAARPLISRGIQITFTACYDAAQVLLADALGANYIAPYLGRINDQGRDGLSELLTMQRALHALESNTRLLVASLRSPSDLVDLAAGGCDTFTISPEIASALLQNPHTTAAAEQFERDATNP
jgi:transaldolase